MPARTSEQRKSSGLDAQLTSQQAVARRVALAVAALLVIALLAPFVAWHLSG
ncbi:MAG: hypothetical protein OEV46_08590 [Betaproteobacteria bacterium]|jgi:hypothetical protein|nr:hypothetical protein [Betaproteobacteria bacterium]MDH5288353.1 hypothetical protein [Betaproteobacteria bacterium]